MKKSKIIIAGLAALAVAATIGGTWAVWSQRLLAKNEYMTAKYSTFLEEIFEAPDAWLPGVEEEKAVWVRNDSTIPIIAKITMSQDWFRREDVTALVVPEGKVEPEEVVVSKKGELLPLTFQGESGKEYAAILNFNKDAVVVLSDCRADEDGLRLDIGEVDSLKEAEGKWLLLSEVPDETGHYTFYYMGTVAPGESTPVLLSSVRMNPLLETTVTGSYTYFVEQEGAEGGYKKVTVSQINSKYGYDSSTYTLHVNMQTVQATKGAVEQILSKDRVTEYIAGYIADTDGGYESDSVKKLLFEEVNGKMTYTPYRTEDGKQMDDPGYWFMSFVNMAPGGTYKDKLIIENASSRNYKVYMRIIPRTDQTQLQDELLKKISMKVYYGDDLIYDGDVTGYHYSDASGMEDMQGLVPLGKYTRGQKREIRVELQLDPDLGLQDDGTYRYADVLTKIDWEFLVQQTSGGGNNPGGGGGGNTPGTTTTVTTNTLSGGPTPGGGLSPGNDPALDVLPEDGIPMALMLARTGDDSNVLLLSVMSALSLLIFAALAVRITREKRK